MAYRIQFRRDTTANWTSINPILLQGEFAYALDTGFAKIGDGTSTWSQLTYFGGTGPTGISGPIGPTGPSVSILGPSGFVFSPGASGIGFTGSSVTNISTNGQFITVDLNGTPLGGPTGSFLSKASTADYDIAWSTSLVSDVPPGSSASPGSTGEIALETDWLYVCVGTDTWRRTALTSWI